MSSINTISAHLTSEHPAPNKMTVKEIIEKVNFLLQSNKEFMSDQAAYDEFVTNLNLANSIEVDFDGYVSVNFDHETALRDSDSYFQQFIILLNTIAMAVGAAFGYNEFTSTASWEEDNQGDIFLYTFYIDEETGLFEPNHTVEQIGIHGYTYESMKDFNREELNQFLEDYGYDEEDAIKDIMDMALDFDFKRAAIIRYFFKENQ